MQRVSDSDVEAAPPVGDLVRGSSTAERGSENVPGNTTCKLAMRATGPEGLQRRVFGPGAHVSIRLGKSREMNTWLLTGKWQGESGR